MLLSMHLALNCKKKLVSQALWIRVLIIDVVDGAIESREGKIEGEIAIIDHVGDAEPRGQIWKWEDEVTLHNPFVHIY